MTTLEKLLRTYEGRTGLSAPPPFRHVYGKRLGRIHWLTSRFVEYHICNGDAAHMLCYQLVIDKPRWRAAKQQMVVAEREVQMLPQQAETYYRRLYQELTQLLPETPP